MFSRAKSFVTLGLFVAAFAAAASASAQGTKVGLIDTRRLITQSAAGKDVIARLETLAEEKGTRIKPLNEEIEALRKRIADGRVSLSDDKLAELRRQLEEKVTSARRLSEDLQREMDEAQATAFSELERKLAPLVEQFGREQGYAFILNIGFFTQANQPSGIVWADERIDVTAELIQRLDAAGAGSD
jgi:outer membrane protein